MLTVVDLFREKGTIDELGLGRIRDAFADRFFPGTSTLHSRTRYWLFVPWLYQRLEASRVRSADAEGHIRRLQAELAGSLERGGQIGVIGIERKDRVLRPPSLLYWAGLGRYGILRFEGSIGRYHASLDHFYRFGRPRRAEGDEAEVVDQGTRNWDDVPPPPADLLTSATFDLRRSEASYLRERFITPDSLLAWGLQHPTRLGRTAAPGEGPWSHPRIGELAGPLRSAVDEAERFSLLMYGAVLVYNLALAEAHARLPGAAEPPDEDAADPDSVARYRTAYEEWLDRDLAPRLGELRAWDRDADGALWELVTGMLGTRSERTRRFCEEWMRAVLRDPAGSRDDVVVRGLIADREWVMKGTLARLRNAEVLRRWSGESGVYRLTYRWAQGRTILTDIAAGLGAADEAA